MDVETLSRSVHQGFQADLDLFYSVLAVSLVAEGAAKRDSLAYATVLYDEILGQVRGEITEVPEHLTPVYTPSVVELIDCAGPESVWGMLDWSVRILSGSPAPHPEGLESVALCLDWEGYENVDDRILASAFIRAFTGSLNKQAAETIA